MSKFSVFLKIALVDKVEVKYFEIDGKGKLVTVETRPYRLFCRYLEYISEPEIFIDVDLRQQPVGLKIPGKYTGVEPVLKYNIHIVING